MANVYAAVSYGQGGRPVDIALTGGGIDRLATRIRALGAICNVFTWDQAAVIAARIAGLASDMKVVVGGASLGANEAPRVGALLKARSVDFMFGIQPSLYGAHNPVTANVKRAMYFYQPWGVGFGIGFGFGSYQWQRASGNNHTALLGYQTYVSHPGDNADSVQNPILAEIRTLTGHS